MAGPITAALLYEALSTELGIVIECDDPQSTIGRLEALRKELKDPDLAMISVLSSPTNPGKEVWLVKRSIPNATQGSLPVGEGDS